MKSRARQYDLILILALSIRGLGLPAQESHGVDVTLRDTSCAPCQAFYEYANGSWVNQQPRPAPNFASGSIEEMTGRSAQVLRATLESLPSTRARAGSPQWKLAEFFESCMDTTAINSAGVDPLMPEIRD